MSHIEDFIAAPIPADAEQIPSALDAELAKLMLYLQAMRQQNPVPEFSVEPSRPHHGMFVTADGVNWNPGHGRGIYWYDEDAWHPIFSADDDSAVVTATVNVDNTTTETEIFTMTVGADKLHLAHVYRLHLSGSYSNQTGADDWVMRVKVNGSTVHTIERAGGNESDAGWEIAHTFTIRALGASGTMIDNSVLIDNNKVYTVAEGMTHAIDTTGVNTLSITLEWNNAKAGNVFALTQGFMENHG